MRWSDNPARLRARPPFSLRPRRMLSPIQQWAALAVLPSLIGACQTPPAAPPPPGTVLPHDQISKMPLEKNIGAIYCAWNAYNPWIWNDERSKIRGLFVEAVYLIGPDSLGAFGDGTIRARVYELVAAGGDTTPTLLKEWPFDVDQAMPWRARRRTVMGWGYKLPLLWNDELNLRGKQIRVTISFERVDGKVFHSGKKDFRVPS